MYHLLEINSAGLNFSCLSLGQILCLRQSCLSVRLNVITWLRTFRGSKNAKTNRSFCFCFCNILFIGMFSKRQSGTPLSSRKQIGVDTPRKSHSLTGWQSPTSTFNIQQILNTTTKAPGKKKKKKCPYTTKKQQLAVSALPFICNNPVHYTDI